MNAQSRPIQSLFVSISLFAVGCIFGGAMRSLWMPKTSAGDEREPTPAISSADWNALKATLARVEAQLANAQLSAPGERAEVGASPIARESIDALAQAVRELQSSIEQSRALADKAVRGSGELVSLHELGQTFREVNSAALEDLVDLETHDEGAALRDVRLATPREILRRFGSPTSLDSGAMLYWRYVGNFDRAAPVDVLQVTFLFGEGYVVQLNIDR